MPETTTMDPPTWWTRAKDGPPDADHVEAWNDLPHQDRQRIRRRVKQALRHEDPDVRDLGLRITQAIEVAEWRGPGLSDHLSLEIAAAHHRGHPLDPGQPVPGCACPDCTGIPEDHPSRVPAWRRRDPERADATDRERRDAWQRRVEDARRIPILDVTALLGCGDPVKQGTEVAVRCPLHDDQKPSMRLDTSTGLWYCDPCGEGGDGILLLMRAHRLDFTDAVKELTS